MIKKNTTQVMVGDVAVGGGAPIVIQSMTNTHTFNKKETVAQILELWSAGSEIVRITVNDEESAKAVPDIKKELLDNGCNAPIVGDFHFNGHKLLEKYPACANALNKYRINPGNVGKGSKRDEQFAAMIKTAIHFDKPIRIGVNWGSLDQDLLRSLMDENAKRKNPLTSQSVMKETLIRSTIDSANAAKEIGLANNKIIVVGGDGFCGWPTSLRLANHNHEVVIIDNLSRRKIDEDLRNNPDQPDNKPACDDSSSVCSSSGWLKPKARPRKNRIIADEDEIHKKERYGIDSDGESCDILPDELDELEENPQPDIPMPEPPSGSSEVVLHASFHELEQLECKFVTEQIAATKYWTADLKDFRFQKGGKIYLVLETDTDGVIKVYYRNKKEPTQVGIEKINPEPSIEENEKKWTSDQEAAQKARVTKLKTNFT